MMHVDATGTGTAVRAGLALLCSLILASPALGQEREAEGREGAEHGAVEEGEEYLNSVAVLLGATTETDPTSTAFTIGVGYVRRLSPLFSVGAAGEVAAELVVEIDAAVRSADDEPLSRIDAVVRAVFRPAVRRPAMLGIVREVSRLDEAHADRLRVRMQPLVDRCVEYLGLAPPAERASFASFASSSTSTNEAIVGGGLPSAAAITARARRSKSAPPTAPPSGRRSGAGATTATPLPSAAASSSTMSGSPPVPCAACLLLP